MTKFVLSETIINVTQTKANILFFKYVSKGLDYEKINITTKLNKKNNVSRIRTKTCNLQFCMWTPEGHQKSKFKSEKNDRNTKSTNRNKKKSLKSMFSTSKMKRSQRFE
jgi:hypothetical protein